jgi:hypothetical protein
MVEVERTVISKCVLAVATGQGLRRFRLGQIRRDVEDDENDENVGDESDKNDSCLLLRGEFGESGETVGASRRCRV